MESEQNIEKESAESRREIMRIGIAADHGGFELKVKLTLALKAVGIGKGDEVIIRKNTILLFKRIDLNIVDKLIKSWR